jgi:hypothetical protein
LDTIKVPDTALDASVGPAKMEQRSRHYYLLSTSLSTAFDIIGVAEFLKALLRILEEWEVYTAEGGASKVVRSPNPE